MYKKGTKFICTKTDDCMGLQKNIVVEFEHYSILAQYYHATYKNPGDIILQRHVFHKYFKPLTKLGNVLYK